MNMNEYGMLYCNYFSNTVHYCRFSLPRLSQMLSFLQSPSFWKAQSALTGQLAQCIVHHKPCRKFNVLPSVQTREGNRASWQTQWWCLYVFTNKPWLRRFLTCCILAVIWPSLSLSLSLSLSHTHTQAAVKIADVLRCDPVSLSLTHAHTHTHTSRE